MGSGIQENDYIYGLQGTGWENDWHRKTTGKPLNEMVFPNMESVPLSAGGTVLPWHIIMGDDGIPYGKPYNPATNPKVLPQTALNIALKGLEGSGIRVERLGTLFGRGMAFTSIFCEELQAVAPPGEHCRLTVHIPLENQFQLRWGMSSTRVVCNNTRNLALQQEDKTGPLAELKTTKFSGAKLELVPESINQAAGVARLFYEQLARLQEIKCDMEGARCLFAGEVVRAGGKLVSSSVKRDGNLRASKALGVVDNLCTLFSGRGIEVQTGTLAGVEQAFTQLFTRGTEESTKDVQAQIASSEAGINAYRKQVFVKTLFSSEERKELRAIGRKALVEAEALNFN
jgi:hypothetical protein